jgi:TAT (twin-arginine translocation) pathway signal sequence
MIARRTFLQGAAAVAATALLPSVAVARSPFEYESKDDDLRNTLISYRVHELEQANKRNGAILEMMCRGKFGTDLYYGRIWHRLYTDLAYGMSCIKPERFTTDDLYEAMEGERAKAFEVHFPQANPERTYAWRVLEYRIVPHVDRYHALWLERGEELGT